MVRFPGKASWKSFQEKLLRPEQLVLATAEQAAQWESTKAELNAEARRTQQRVEAEHDARFAMARYYVDGAEEPQLCGIYEEGVEAALVPGRAQVYLEQVGLTGWIPYFEDHLPARLQSLKLLRATTKEDLVQMGNAANWKLDSAMIQKVLGYFSVVPQVNLEAEATWAATKAELDAKAAAHLVSLVVGAAVTWTDTDRKVPEGTAGEIIEILEDNDKRMVRFPGATYRLLPEQLVLATTKQAAQWEATKAELDAKAAAQRTQELPVVREIFMLFDTDGDGRLSKGEYKRYLQGIGYWVQRGFTDESYDESGWHGQCKGIECPPEEGVSAEAFETILYGTYRVGKARADLDRCQASTPERRQRSDEERNARVAMAGYYANGVEEPQLCGYYTAPCKGSQAAGRGTGGGDGAARVS
jgi:hypothetical protein